MLLSQDGFCCLMYPFFLEPPNLLRNLQCRLQDVRVPTLGAQHEGKSAHILRSSGIKCTSNSKQASKPFLPSGTEDEDPTTDFEILVLAFQPRTTL